MFVPISVCYSPSPHSLFINIQICFHYWPAWNCCFFSNKCLRIPLAPDARGTGSLIRCLLYGVLSSILFRHFCYFISHFLVISFCVLFNHFISHFFHDFILHLGLCSTRREASEVEERKAGAVEAAARRGSGGRPCAAADTRSGRRAGSQGN